MSGEVYFDHHHEEWVGEYETRDRSTGEIHRRTAWFRHRYQAEEFRRDGVPAGRGRAARAACGMRPDVREFSRASCPCMASGEGHK